MMGLVSAEEHAKVTRERDDAQSLLRMKKAELEQADATATRATSKLTAARNEASSLHTSLTGMTKERDEAVRNYSTMSGTVSERDAEIVRLRAEVDDLKPDAEKFRARRASAKAYDENRRAKAAAPVAKPAPKAKAAAKKAVRK